MTTYSILGPHKGKIVDVKPVSGSVVELIIEGPKKKKFTYKVGKRSEFVRRALRQNDPNVSFTLDNRGKITVLTKSRIGLSRR
ncbi:MAG: hypothetical protein KAT43_03860 [Nanoarchaeota archaeon]|nr:hypothetical protein [Nanoarchaeota archaeon]